MGIAGDGIEQGDANGQQLKTPPLWGVAYRDPLWHDGRFSAGTIDSRIRDAIAEHGVFGSQGLPSAENFAALSGADQNALLAFLRSLGQIEFDSDSDGDVELNDFHGYSDTVGFQPCFGETVNPDDPCTIHDVDQDGDIDLDDFDLFLLAFDDALADCNENGTSDLLDILLGEADKDNNGILDICQTCVGDLNGDNTLDVSEILAMIDAWGPCENCAADINNDDVVDVNDLLYIVGNWGPCS